MRHEHKFQKPFQISINGENSFLVNGGRVFNYHNPLNYALARFQNQSGPTLVQLSKSQGQSFIIDEKDIEITIWLMGSFKTPAFWVPGMYWVPEIDKCWVTFQSLREGEVNTTIEGPDIFSMMTGPLNFSMTNVYNHEGDARKFIRPAATLYCIGKMVKTEEGDWEIKQLLDYNYPLFFTIRQNQYSVINVPPLSVEVGPNEYLTRTELDAAFGAGNSVYLGSMGGNNSLYTNRGGGVLYGSDQTSDFLGEDGKLLGSLFNYQFEIPQ